MKERNKLHFREIDKFEKEYDVLVEILSMIKECNKRGIK